MITYFLSNSKMSHSIFSIILTIIIMMTIIIIIMIIMIIILYCSYRSGTKDYKNGGHIRSGGMQLGEGREFNKS